MAPIQTNNYDVLLEQQAGETLQLSDSRMAVGNKRLEVLLSMHHAQYTAADEAKDEYIDKLIDIVCQQCVPNGRFLLAHRQNGTNVVEWEELDPVRVRQFLRAQLAALPSKGAAAVLPPAMPPAPSQFRNSAPEREDSKRKRRSSLLRRSVSEGGLRHGSKKDLRRGSGAKQLLQQLWRPRSLGNLGKNTNNKKSIQKPQPLDIILSSTRNALEQGLALVGNNRLRVLLDVQQQNISSGELGRNNADPAAVQSIAMEMVQTVTQHWNGRFLVKQNASSYLVLDESEACEALQAILGATSAPTPQQVSSMNNSSSSLDKVTSSLNAIHTSSPGDARRASTVKHESIKALHEIAPPIAKGLERVRSDAIADLKKGGARKGVFERMTDYSSKRSQNVVTDGSTAVPAAVPSSSLPAMPNRQSTNHRAVSEPVMSGPRMSDFSDGMLGDVLDQLDISELGLDMPPVEEEK